MSGPDAPGLEDLYEDISDTELTQRDLEDVEPNAPSYSDTAARGTSPDRKARAESNDGQPRRAQHHIGQYRVLSIPSTLRQTDPVRLILKCQRTSPQGCYFRAFHVLVLRPAEFAAFSAA